MQNSMIHGMLLKVSASRTTEVLHMNHGGHPRMAWDDPVHWNSVMETRWLLAPLQRRVHTCHQILCHFTSHRFSTRWRLLRHHSWARSTVSTDLYSRQSDGCTVTARSDTSSRHASNPIYLGVGVSSRSTEFDSSNAYVRVFRT